MIDPDELRAVPTTMANLWGLESHSSSVGETARFYETPRAASPSLTFAANSRSRTSLISGTVVDGCVV